MLGSNSTQLALLAKYELKMLSYHPKDNLKNGATDKFCKIDHEMATYASDI